VAHTHWEGVNVSGAVHAPPPRPLVSHSRSTNRRGRGWTAPLLPPLYPGCRDSAAPISTPYPPRLHETGCAPGMGGLHAPSHRVLPLPLFACRGAVQTGSRECPPPPLSPCFCAHAKGLCEWRLRSPKVTRKPGAPELGRWRPSLPLSAEDEARQRDPNRQVRVREQRGMQPGQAQKGERGKAVQPGWASNSEWGKHTVTLR
jgi:hypothetical protein